MVDASKVVDAQFGEKKKRDRVKVLKMGLGDSRPLGSRESPVPWSYITFI